MKPMTILLGLGVAMTLTACQTNTQTNTAPQPSSISMTQPAQPTTQSTPMTHEHLTGSWQLMDNQVKGNKYKPLILNFANNQVSVINGCNNLRANYHIHNGTIQIGSPISTRMMCEKPLMEIDNLATALFKGNIVLENDAHSPSNPYLKITANDNDFILEKIK